MPGQPDLRRPRPSQVTDDYWIHAYAPDRRQQYAAGEGRSGKWLVFVPLAELDAWWELVRAATGRGALGAAAKAVTARPDRAAGLGRRQADLRVHARLAGPG